MDIGRRIRQLRKKNDLTLEELASRSEVTKGFLSQLENNAASPSVKTLEDIVEALGTDMATFFKEESEMSITFTQEDFFVDEKEGFIKTYIIPNAQKNEMEPILVELEPGYQTDVIPPFEGEEFGYVLQGKVELVMLDRTYTIRKGETFYLNGNRTHHLKNTSNHVAKVLWISTPPIF